MAELPKPLEILVRSDVMLQSHETGKLLIYDATKYKSETGNYFLGPEDKGQLGFKINKGEINYRWAMKDCTNNAEYIAFDLEVDPRDNKTIVFLKTKRIGRKPKEIARFHLFSLRESMREYEANLQKYPKYEINFESYISRISEVNQ